MLASKKILSLYFLLSLATSIIGEGAAKPLPIYHAQGEMAGEATSSSIILQSRLTASPTLENGDVPGTTGCGKFQISETPNFENCFETLWIRASEENDFIFKTKVAGLRPSHNYYYRLVFGPNQMDAQTGPIRRFKTLPLADQGKAIRFVVGNCMNYAFFYNGPKGDGANARTNILDRQLGYPAMESIRKLNPDFFIGAGDNVYYDHPAKTAAKTVPELRRKWHEQFVLPRVVDLLGEVSSYWIKDDHDYRYNDAYATGKKAPSHELGIKTFREQMPVIDPLDPQAVTYRTLRCGRWLQLWLVEGRDFRSQNNMTNGPGKSIWGAKQKAWLERTLLASDALFKILISPTPMVGPDDAYKKDNHVSKDGFSYEGEEFFNWLKSNKVNNFFIITGDRHWHYHSIHPSGYEEFSCGALNVENARLGRTPGDLKSTDTERKVKQLYTDSQPTGGYLIVEVHPKNELSMVQLKVCIHDEQGKELYSHTKKAVFR